MKKKVDVKEMVTKKIVDSLENGIVPWHKPWKSANPQNMVGKNEYRGINQLLLALGDYETPYFLTYKQAKTLGGHVKKGEESTFVVYWNIVEKKIREDDGEEKILTFPILKYIPIFNVSQTTVPEEKIPSLKQIENFRDNQKIEDFVQGLIESGKIPEIGTNAGKAFFSPAEDRISLPKRETFDSEDEFYSTLFHEIIHSTGHKDRLDRLGKENYAQEELCAELGASILCHIFGVTKGFDNSASYIGNWLKELNNDKSLIIKASSYAQKAIDYLIPKEEVSDENA